jgi:hypothetical protein
MKLSYGQTLPTATTTISQIWKSQNQWTQKHSLTDITTVSQSYIERGCNGVLDAMHNWATLGDHGCKLVLVWCPSSQQGENMIVEPPGLLCIVQKCCYFLQTIPLLSNRYHGNQPSTTPGPITLDSLHEVLEDSAVHWHLTINII